MLIIIVTLEILYSSYYFCRQQSNKSMDRYIFVTIDFEFSMVDRTSIVLVAGAISNSLGNLKVIKLEGKPIVLPTNGRNVPLTFFKLEQIVDEAIRIFKNKADYLDLILIQLRKGLEATKSNLGREFIIHYLNKGNKTSVIVFFCGDTDETILKRLKITGYPIFNILSFDKDNNKNFYVQLIYFKTKEIIFTKKIGRFQNKQGRYLNLMETHDLMCSEKHGNISYLHDPETDVLYTNCIFDKIIKQFGYDNIISFLDKQKN